MKKQGIQHPKVKALRRTLQIPHAHAVGVLEMLWHFTAEYAPQGDVGRYDDAEIAEAVGWPEDDAERLVEALIHTGLIDRQEACRLVVHDWHEHAEEWALKRIERSGLALYSGPALRSDGSIRIPEWTEQHGGRQRQPLADDGGCCLPTQPGQAQPSQAKPGQAPPPPSPQAEDGGGGGIEEEEQDNSQRQKIVSLLQAAGVATTDSIADREGMTPQIVESVIDSVKTSSTTRSPEGLISHKLRETPLKQLRALASKQDKALANLSASERRKLYDACVEAGEANGPISSTDSERAMRKRLASGWAPKPEPEHRRVKRERESPAHIVLPEI